MKPAAYANALARRTSGLRVAAVLFVSVLIFPAATPAALDCPNAEVDFGQVKSGQKVENVFLLANRSQSPVTIRKITTTADFAEIHLYGRGGETVIGPEQGDTHLELAPGQKARLWFSADTSSFEGNVRRKIIVESTDAARPSLTLTVSFKVIPAPVPAPSPGTDIRSRGGTPEGPSNPPGDNQGAAQPTTNGPAPRLEIDTKLADFGDVLLGEKVKKNVTLSNKGPGDLKITRIDKSCGCTVPKILVGGETIDLAELNTGKKTVTLATDESAQMEIQFDSKGQRPGKIRRSVTVHSNDPAQPRVVVDLKVHVVRAYQMTPANIRFPEIKRHHSATASVTFKSSLLKDLELLEAIPPDPSVKVEWKKLAPSDAEPDIVAFQIDVTVGQDAPVGSIQHPVLIRTNNPKVSEFVIPIYAHVVPEVSFTFLNSRSAAKVDFGIITEPKPVSLDVKISNANAQIPYTVDQIEVISKHKDQIKAELVTEQEGVSYILRLTISEDLKARYFRGTVRLYSRHPDLPRKEIPFQGWITR